MAQAFRGGSDHVDGDWASQFVFKSKEEFVDALSFVCAKCQCKTSISIPKAQTVHMTDLCCPVCKELLLLTALVAQSN